VRLVIADSGPVNYLILIGQVDLLTALFGGVIIPADVYRELSSAKAPALVRGWAANQPAWVEVRETNRTEEIPQLNHLDAGEKAAIRLAVSISADLLLMDDRDGVAAARGMGLRVTGTLGILDLAAEKGLVDFRDAITALARTTFRRPDTLLAELLRKHQSR